MQANQNFPAIGALAEQTDALNAKAAASATEGNTDEERPLQEIESLCMNCGQQVRNSESDAKMTSQWLINIWLLGSNSVDAHVHSVLQGSHSVIISL
jgi:hypothetical protein